MQTNQNEHKRIEHRGYIIEFSEYGTFLFPKNECDRPEFSAREHLSMEAAKLIAEAYHAGWHRGYTAGRAELALSVKLSVKADPISRKF